MADPVASYKPYIAWLFDSVIWCAVCIGVLLGVGCKASISHDAPHEVLLFAVQGDRPFTDAILTVAPNGSVAYLLKPFRKRSYLFASGSSLKRDLMVLVHEIRPDGSVTDRIHLYSPKSRKWRPLDSMAGREGNGALSPNGLHAVYEFAPGPPPAQYTLWLASVATGEVKNLTGKPEPRQWDAYPAWRPDGAEIVFLRIQRTGGGLRSQLMRVSPDSDQPSPLLALEEAAAAVCYAPSGDRLAVASARGVEVIDLSGMRRTLIAPWAQLGNAQYYGGGLSWSRNQDLLAIALFNRETGQYEIRRLSTDGRFSHTIYSTHDGRIMGLSFIER